MPTRREALAAGLKASALATLYQAGWRPTLGAVKTDLWVNDVHSELNETRIAGVISPTSVEQLQETMHKAASEGKILSVAAARHAMGGQQFGTDTLLLNMTGLNHVVAFDRDKGEVEVGSGIMWPDLVEALLREQKDADQAWGIVQKQTGADRLSVGGALAANAHGRGLRYKPIVQDVEAFSLVDPRGELVRCSRTENPELFRLCIGGYGLFGVIATVRLRLAPRRKIRRVVEVIDAATLSERFAERISQGYLYGDFQYSTDVGSETLLRKGVFSCYVPVDPDTPMPQAQAELSRESWMDLICLGHIHRGEAFRKYSEYYLTTSGQVYWSDTHQLSVYIEDYHQALRKCLGKLAGGTEMITEIYVPREALGSFLEEARGDVTQRKMNLIYGTVRLIEKDDETFMAWAKQPYACIIFNLHVSHDPAGLKKAQEDFRALIGRGIAHGGSYYLTYHRWAAREQVLACYPQFPEFLAKKRKLDPAERIQSDWYRYYRALFPAG